MINTVSFIEIQSSNPEREVAFYTALFGWKFTKQEQAHIEYYHFDTPTIYGGLMKRVAAVPPQEAGTNAFTCSVCVDDFDTTAEKIVELGGKVAMPKFAIEGKCWQGYFLDPDNNTFGIFKVDPEAK